MARQFYTCRIIDKPTKLEVCRMKGSEGADILMENVEMKIEQNHECLLIVLQIMKNQECLHDVVRRMRENEGITYTISCIPILYLCVHFHT